MDGSQLVAHAPKRKRLKRETRALVIETARSLFLARGYEDTMIRDVARAADKSTGSVFSNFESKEELFIEVLREEHKKRAEEALEEDHPGLALPDRITQLFCADFAGVGPQFVLLHEYARIAFGPHSSSARRLQADLEEHLDTMLQAMLDGQAPFPRAAAVNLREVLLPLRIEGCHRVLAGVPELQVRQWLRHYVSLILPAVLT